MTQTLDRDAVSLVVPAAPDRVYALVSDVTRTPEYSPEVTSCTWVSPVDHPRPGDRFRAVNNVGRGRPWTNTPVVVTATPGREFAFARTERMAGTVEWRFVLEPVGDDTTLVTQSYEVTAPVSRLGWFWIGTVYGRKNRRADLRRGMEQSLERIREILVTEDGRRPPA